LYKTKGNGRNTVRPGSRTKGEKWKVSGEKEGSRNRKGNILAAYKL